MADQPLYLCDIEVSKSVRAFFDSYRYQRGFLDQALDGLDGHVWADADSPQAALVLNVFCYVGGAATAESARLIIDQALICNEPLIVVDPAWQALVEQEYADRYQQTEAVSFSSNSINIDTIRVLKMSIPDDITIQRLDRETARRLFDAKIRVFRTYGHDPDRFIDEGIGFYAQKGAQIVSIINTMAIYQGKVKGYIDTHPHYRGQGLAVAVAAHLVEYCWEHQLEYCWEAMNPASASVARRLGLQENARIAVYRPQS